MRYTYTVRICTMYSWA